MDKKKVYVIAGPTCSGKSTLAYFLAHKINGEIVNCDSVQLYKYMDIGSAKPDLGMMQTIPHHLFSIVDPNYDMTVATYQKLAFACIKDIVDRGKTPIVVGGTGLYINALLYKMDFGGSKDNGERREELEKMAEENGNEYMHSYLAAIDPEAAERIHPNNIRKVIRAIEAYEIGDGIKSLEECELNDDYDWQFCALNLDREWLYERINKRVDELIALGLIKEVKGLKEVGYEECSSMKAIGYKEILDYLNDKISLEEAVDLIKKNTRHYAKRQLTWFKRYKDVHWIDVPKNVSVADIVAMILEATN